MKNHALLKSFGYAFKGLKLAWSERNFKLHLLSTFTVVCLGFYFGISRIEWIAVLGCVALVVSLELMNTAIENLVDLVSPGYSEKAGKIKDISAAAVLAASILVLIIAIIIFLPYLY